VGFSGPTIDLSSLDPVSYPSIAIGATLSTTDSSFTPELFAWNLGYVMTESTHGSVPFTLTGSKTIGTIASGSPVYKFSNSYVTDSEGKIEIKNLEWDSYTIALTSGSYDIAEACNSNPYTLLPNVNDSVKVTLASNVTNTLRVEVVDINGIPIVGATVDLSRPGFSDSDTTSTCGQVFFNSGLSVANDYVLDISASGYSSKNLTGIDVNGDSVVRVTLN